MYKLGLDVEGLCDEDIAVSGQFCARLRVVPHLSSGKEERSETRARVKITPREKRRHAAGREKNENSFSFLNRS